MRLRYLLILMMLAYTSHATTDDGFPTVSEEIASRLPIRQRAIVTEIVSFLPKCTTEIASMIAEELNTGGSGFIRYQD